MRHSEHICPRYQHAAEIVAKRWTALILKVLMPNPLRFNEIADQLDGISDRVLSERLKELEHEGILLRRVLTEPPVRVLYALTEKGQALSPIVNAIEDWSQSWIPLDAPLNIPLDISSDSPDPDIADGSCSRSA